MHRPTEIAAKIAGKASGVRAALVGKGGIFKRLVEEHAEVSVLLDRISRTTDAETKRELFSHVRREVLAHSKAEEREFYAALRDNPRTRSLVETSLHEHGEIDELIDRLSATPISDPGWDGTFQRLASEIEAHVRREEGEVFEEATKIIDRGESRVIAARFRQRKADELDNLP